MAEADGVEALALRCNEADNTVIPSAWYGPKLVGIAPQVAHARAFRIRSINMFMDGLPIGALPLQRGKFGRIHH